MFDDQRQFSRPSDAVLSVTQLNTRAKQLLERNIGQVAVAGEISNLRHDRSGHRYFTLKDEGGVLSSALFRQRASHLTFEPADGMQVVATGQVTIYSPQGRYQLMVTRLIEAGAGALQAAFDRLKRKLDAEGLFAASKKRKLPKVPRRIAVVTSPHGAVWRDIVQVSQRRFAHAPLLQVPCRVQGPECVPEVLAALALVAREAERLQIDVVVLARGGGSLEDLWGFNDERVARAIAACPIPVVSAVGHETDFTIADFVADVRAPTPSAAAELIVPKRVELCQHLRQMVARLSQAVSRDVSRAQLRLRAARAELGDGQPLLWRPTQRLSQMDARLISAMRALMAQKMQRLHASERSLSRQHPRAQLARQQITLAQLRGRIAQVQHRIFSAQRSALERHAASLKPDTRRICERKRARLAQLTSQLMALSPRAVLGRGYAIVTDDQGHVVRRADAVALQAHLTVQLGDGQLRARVCPP